MVSPILLFLFICVPLRSLLIWHSTKVPNKYLSVILLAFSLSFLYLYFSNSRLKAPEAGGMTWWAPYRLIIGLLYLASAIYAFQGRTEMVRIPLIIDVILGLILFLIKHFY
jgi:hypothetical protein